MDEIVFDEEFSAKWLAKKQADREEIRTKPPLLTADFDKFLRYAEQGHPTFTLDEATETRDRLSSMLHELFLSYSHLDRGHEYPGVYSELNRLLISVMDGPGWLNHLRKYYLEDLRDIAKRWPRNPGQAQPSERDQFIVEQGKAGVPYKLIALQVKDKFGDEIGESWIGQILKHNKVPPRYSKRDSKRSTI